MGGKLRSQLVRTDPGGGPVSRPLPPGNGTHRASGRGSKALGRWGSSTSPMWWILPALYPRCAGDPETATLPQEVDAVQDIVTPSLALAAAHAGDLEALRVLMELVSPAAPAPSQASGTRCQPTAGRHPSGPG